MNNKMKVCPDCDAAEYGNLFCNTCIEEFERKMGKSEFTSTLKKINLQRKKPNKTNKPDWKDAPEWANWMAMDENGDWYWYEDKPEMDDEDCEWSSSTGNAEIAKWHCDYTWPDTLEGKPQ